MKWSSQALMALARKRKAKVPLKVLAAEYDCHFSTLSFQLKKLGLVKPHKKKK